MKRIVVVILSVTLLAGIVVLVLPREPVESPPATIPAETTEPAEPVDIPAAPTAQIVAPEQDSAGATAEKPVELDNAFMRRCLVETRPETIPQIAADIDRLEPYTIRHPSMKTYRSIGATELESIAVQGDTAAMAVLAAHYFLEASGVEGLDAADYASSPAQQVSDWREDALELPGVRENFDKALYWYKEAALHGRYAALPAIGNLYARAGMNAVDLGWLSQEDFDSLSPLEQSKWSPYNVYYEMGNSMMSDAWTGPTAELAEIAGFFKRDAQNEIVDAMLNVFLDDIQERGLQIQTVEPWDGPPLVDILGEFCPEAFENPED